MTLTEKYAQLQIVGSCCHRYSPPVNEPSERNTIMCHSGGTCVEGLHLPLELVCISVLSVCSGYWAVLVLLLFVVVWLEDRKMIVPDSEA